jgi:L-xylulokinase
LSGGGVRSPHWPQMFADCLGVPITVAEAQETGALGAAIGAGLAVGQFVDYEEGIRAMTRSARKFTPDPTHLEFYEKRYSAWCDLSERMRDFWSSLNDRD